MAQPSVYGVRETLAEIKKIDEQLYWRSVQQIKNATKPLESALALEFPVNAPMRGMAHRGRTAWKKPKIASKFGGKKDKTVDEWGLVKVTVTGVAPQMIDMAKTPNNGVTTRSYNYKNGKRTHKVNGQGQRMIQNLGGSPSRYIWPTAEAFRPMVTRALLQAIEDVSRIVNKNLVVRNEKWQ